jgi:hypothetical protein
MYQKTSPGFAVCVGPEASDGIFAWPFAVRPWQAAHLCAYTSLPAVMSAGAVLEFSFVAASAGALWKFAFCADTEVTVAKIAIASAETDCFEFKRPSFPA